MTGVSFDQKPILSVSVLVTNRDNDVLLTKRGTQPNKGLWSLPGGKVHIGETLCDAGRREVKEESEIDVEGLAFQEFVEIIEDDHHFVIALFMANLTNTQTAIAGDDACEARWLNAKEIKILDGEGKMTSGTYERILRLTKSAS